MAKKFASQWFDIQSGLKRIDLPAARGLCISLVLVILIACGGGKKTGIDPKTKSDKEIYEIGQTYMKNEDYDEAREAFRTVFDNFPKSDYRILSKLALADTYYQQGTSANWFIAIQEYQDFISLFPFSPKACYAQLQAGRCYFGMAEKPDRDQTNTRKALDEFRKVVDNYPDCENYQEAYDALLNAYSRLAEHDYLIGHYYQRTGRHQAAVERFKGILKVYPERVYQPKHIYGLAESLEKLEQYPESCTYYEMLLEKWPKSEYASDATKNKARVCALATPPSSS